MLPLQDLVHGLLQFKERLRVGQDLFCLRVSYGRKKNRHPRENQRNSVGPINAEHAALF